MNDNRLFIEALYTLHELSRIEGRGSESAKVKWIKEGESDELKALLQTALDPLTSLGIKTLVLPNEAYIIPDHSETQFLYGFNKLIDELKQSKGVTDDMYLQVSMFIECVRSWFIDEENKTYSRLVYSQQEVASMIDLLKKVFAKKLNVGVKAKTVNKAFPNLIFDGSVMLSGSSDLQLAQKWMDEDRIVYIEEKFDGVRVIYRNGKLYTRSFRELDSNCFPNILNQLNRIAHHLPDNSFIDGELVSDQRTDISGSVNKILKGTANSGMDSDWKFVMFDSESNTVLDDAKIKSNDFRLRRRILHDAWMYAGSTMNIELSTVQIANDLSDIYKAYSSVINRGGEGVMIKHGDHRYQPKRSKDWIKVKEVKECELVVINVTMGAPGTKREGLIASIDCVSADSKVQVSVGSGFSNEFLSTHTDDDLIGAIVTVKYNYVIKSSDKRKPHSLYLPRFVQIRLDKTTADIIKV